MCPLQTKGAYKGNLFNCWLLLVTLQEPVTGLLDTNSNSAPLGAEPCRGTEMIVLDPGRCGGLLYGA